MQKTDISIESLGAFSVLNGHGESIQLASLWKNRTAVLVFVRHSGRGTGRGLSRAVPCSWAGPLLSMSPVLSAIITQVPRQGIIRQLKI